MNTITKASMGYVLTIRDNVQSGSLTYLCFPGTRALRDAERAKRSKRSPLIRRALRQAALHGDAANTVAYICLWNGR